MADELKKYRIEIMQMMNGKMICDVRNMFLKSDSIQITLLDFLYKAVPPASGTAYVYLRDGSEIDPVPVMRINMHFRGKKEVYDLR